MANETDTSVYVDTAELESWSSQLASINSKSIDIIESFRTAVEDLGEIWEGNSADGFYASVEEMVKLAKDGHNQMKDVDRFLLNVVDVMENQ